jgi:hypothetical protein
MKALTLSVCLLLASLVSAAPAKSGDHFVEIKAGDPITIRPDRAYLLFRTNSKETRVFVGISPVFLRIPTAAEMDAYDAAKRSAFAKAEAGLKRKRDDVLAQKAAAERSGQPFTKAVPPVPTVDTFNFVYDGIRNLYSPRLGRALEKPADERVLLIEALPGEYVFYGWGMAETLNMCLCLGTVSFSAEAGTITNLGTLLVDAAAEPSSIPELKAMSGLGASMNGRVVLHISAVRPATSTTPIPSALAGKPIVPARYRATGKFVSPFALGINRLAPIPGILGYDRGTVLDLVSGKPAEDHYY